MSDPIYTITPATAADCRHIAHVFTADAPSYFHLLQRGEVGAAAAAASGGSSANEEGKNSNNDSNDAESIIRAGRRLEHIIGMWQQAIADPGRRVLVARRQLPPAAVVGSDADPKSEVEGEDEDEVVGYAEWVLPRQPVAAEEEDKANNDEEKKKKKEQEQARKAQEEKKQKVAVAGTREGETEPEQRARRLAAAGIGALNLEWEDQLAALHRDAFSAQPSCYFLNNIGVLAAHRGHGLATQMVMWGLEKAEREGIAAGLFTDGLGKARPLYERLGFQKAGGFELRLEDFGGEGRKVEIAMIKEPRKA